MDTGPWTIAGHTIVAYPSANFPTGEIREDIEMRIFIAAVVIAFLTAPVCAQGFGKGGGSGKPGQKTEAEVAEERKNKKIDDKAYNDAVARIPDKTPAKKPDPWGNLR